MRKWAMLIVCLTALLGAVAPAAAKPATWVCPAGFEGQTLSVYNWTTYVAENTISNFEEACGVTVVYDTFDSGDALLARLRQGNPGYDIVVPPSSNVESMILENLLTPLDLSLIPNYANVIEAFKSPAYDPGNQFTVPYQWGTIGVGYDMNKVGKEITSWNDVWEYSGPVAWLEDRRPMLGIGLLMLGFDPNSTNEDEITAAKDYLIEHGGNVTYIAGDDGQELLARGDVDITIEFMGDIYQKIAECKADANCTKDLHYAIPNEGANAWTDNLAIPLDAPNVPLAHAFMDYILDPNVGADISNYTSFATPNQAALDQGLIVAEALNDSNLYPPPELLSKLFFINANVDFEQLYNDAWDEIKIAVGG